MGRTLNNSKKITETMKSLFLILIALLLAGTFAQCGDPKAPEVEEYENCASGCEDDDCLGTCEAQREYVLMKCDSIPPSRSACMEKCDTDGWYDGNHKKCQGYCDTRVNCTV